MRSIEERERALNHEEVGYKGIAHELIIPLDTIKSLARRYRIANGIPKRYKAPLAKKPVKKERLHERKVSDLATMTSLLPVITSFYRIIYIYFKTSISVCSLKYQLCFSPIDI